MVGDLHCFGKSGNRGGGGTLGDDIDMVTGQAVTVDAYAKPNAAGAAA